jgi:hypothetical protein
MKNSTNKRISNREYPPIICHKTGCDKLFKPTNKRQIYCGSQHRNDQNNDNRAIRDEAINNLKKRLQHNWKALKKIFESVLTTKNKCFTVDLLIHEKFDFNIDTGSSLNTQTNKKIRWTYEYGLEVYDSKANTFIIHKKNANP